MEIGSIIMKKRKRTWYHATVLADKLHVSNQAVSKWGKWNGLSGN